MKHIVPVNRADKGSSVVPTARLFGLDQAQAALGRSITPEALKAGNDEFVRAMRQANLGAASPKWVKEMGRVALGAKTMPADVYLGLFSVLKNVAWPEGFRCTATDAETGELVVWDEGSGVSLLEAVASSCAVPALFPIISISGRSYMDGGIISYLNATSVSPSDVVLVLSCHPLGERVAETHDALVTSHAAKAELEQLRESSRLVVIEPDFSSIEVTPNMMMDPMVAAQAVQLGRRQAEREVEMLRAVWEPLSWDRDPPHSRCTS